jgi:photosystem II stability/assembly factor-like uncharacterized protein
MICSKLNRKGARVVVLTGGVVLVTMLHIACRNSLRHSGGETVVPVTADPTDNTDIDSRVVAAGALKREADKPQNPGQRFREWYADRTGGDGLFSFEEVYAAKAHIEQMPDRVTEPGVQPQDAGIWSWEPLGPGNIGGRIRAIHIDRTNADIMWIGSVGGGIWKTTDGGGNWEPINDFLPSLAVTAIVADPTDPAIMYASTGEGFFNTDALPGGGVFKSTDGGDSWNPLSATVPTGDPTGHPWGWVNDLAISPDGATLLAATRSGLWRGLFGGTSWTRVAAGRFGDVKFHPRDSLRAVAGGLFNGSARYTTDGGITWNPCTFTGVPASATLQLSTTRDSDTTPDTIVLNNAAEFKPRPGTTGGDLIRIGTATTVETVEVLSVVNPLAVPPTTLTVSDLSRSHSAGDPVQSIPSGRVELAYAPSDPQLVYASMDVGRGSIWWSLNGGQDFSLLSNTPDDYLGTQGWYDNVIWVAPDDPVRLVVGGIDLWRFTAPGGSLRRISDWRDYHDGLDTDTDGNVANSAHADQHIIVAHPGYNGAANRIAFVGNDGGIQKRNDMFSGGPNDNWTNLANNLGISQFYGGAASPDGQWILGGTQDNSGLRYSPSDGPNAWYQSTTGDGGFAAIDYNDSANPKMYYAGQNLTVLRSTDGGTSYSLATSGLADSGNANNSRFIAPFVMDPNVANNLVAGGSSIWRTTNEAGNWGSIRSPIAGNPKCSAIDVALGNSGRIWAGYDSGRVSRTTTNVSTWANVDDNGANPLPNRVVTDIAISPYHSSDVFVAFGGYEADNVWFTDDDGATWERRTGTTPHDLPAIHVTSIRFHPTEPDWIYIGTDLGVFASEDRGNTWNRTPRFADSEGPTYTQVSEIFWQGDYLIAATHGRGMFRVRPLNNVYIDIDEGGPNEDGTLAFPFDLVREGIGAAGHGSDILIFPGVYDEGPISFFKRGEIRRTGSGGNVVIR